MGLASFLRRTRTSSTCSTQKGLTGVGHTLLGLGSTAGVALLLSGVAWAEEQYPAKPITLVLPSAPGGSVDPLARFIQPALSRRLGQPIVIDNRPGASGQIATNLVARAAPDGYTVLLAYDSHVLNAVAAKRSRPLPYDIFKDFAPVSLVARIPYVLGVASTVPAKDVGEFVAHVKANPGRYNYASSGAGSMTHLAAERFKQQTGTDIVHVPYKAGNGVQAIMSSDVQLGFFSYLLMKPGVQAGKIKVLATADARRLPGLPDVPTMTEVGFRGFEAYTWYGVFVPARTPAAIVERLQREIVAVLNDAAIRKQIAGAGFTVLGSSPADLAAFVRSEFERWDKFASETGVKLSD